MEVIITQWVLDAYLDLKHKQVFDQQEFNTKIRPDVELLARYPNEPKFNNGKFWSLANDANGIIPFGYKMKWHQIGNGKIQLRLPVALLKDRFLCEAYVKSDDKIDKRKIAKLKTHIQLIQQSQYTHCGVL